MAKLTDFIPQADIDFALENDDEVIAYKVAVAKQGVDYAKSKAPEDEGDYKDGIRVGRSGNSGVDIEFSDWKSHILEWGAEGNKPAFNIRTHTENYLRETEGR